MHALYKQFQNALTRNRDHNDRACLKSLFPDLKSRAEIHFLALRRYIHGRPERFFDRAIYQLYLDWLKKRDQTDGDSLRGYLSARESEINRALLFLRGINSEYWHDTIPSAGDEYDLIRFIDKNVHPAYLRLVEAVLIPLAKPVTYFSRLDASKGTEGLNVWSVVQELMDGEFDLFVRPYNHLIRNGIGHGGITYLQNEIRYCDKKGNEQSFNARSIVRLCDDLLDTCNGLAAALKVFLIVSREFGYKLPFELLLEELQEETQTPWWKIDGCVESELVGRSQLLIYARPATRDSTKVHWSAIQSAIMAEYFAPGYDRYFFSLRSPKALPGWAAFDGKKMRDLREGGIDDIPPYAGIIEEGGMFYLPKWPLPHFLCKLDTLLHAFRINWPLTLQEVRQKLGIPSIICRRASAHRNAWGAVVTAEVLVECLDSERTMSLIRNQRRRIVKAAVKKARDSVNGINGAAYLPLGCAYISVFRNDHRRRRLSGFGLGEDLVCTVRFQRIRRIKTPDIMGSTVETFGKWRFAWNKAWLEATAPQIN